MSSGEDSETAEWEREQMLRGTQSRRQKYEQPRSEKKTDVIDATMAKKHVTQDIEKIESSIENIKRSIGVARLDIVKSEKRIVAFRKRIENLESNESLFDELASLDDPSVILDLLERNRSTISELPQDQKEILDFLETRLKDNLKTMDID